MWPYPHQGFRSPWAIGRNTDDGYRWESWVCDYSVVIDGARARKRFTFGPFSDTIAALVRWEAHRAELEAGRWPDLRRLDPVPTLADAADRFLEIEHAAVGNGRSLKTWKGIQTVMRWMVYDQEHIGPRTPTTHIDARAYRTLAKGFAACSKSTQDKRVRYLRRFDRVMRAEGVRFGLEAGPDGRGKFPEEWRVRPKATDRRERARIDPESLYMGRADLHRLLAAARPSGADPDTLGHHARLVELRARRLTAWMLLGANGGMLPSDIGVLRVASIDYARGLIIEPRSKTGERRAIALWPETARALRLAIEPGIEAHPCNPDGLAFLTRPRALEGGGESRGPVYYTLPGGNPYNAVSDAFRKIARPLGIAKGFATLRHTFATIANRAGDDNAVSLTMGHAETSITRGKYVHETDAQRLRAVAETVRRWLFFAPDHAGPTAYLGVVNPGAAQALDRDLREEKSGDDDAGAGVLGMFVDMKQETSRP